jgi:hypothetical protein
MRYFVMILKSVPFDRSLDVGMFVKQVVDVNCAADDHVE